MSPEILKGSYGASTDVWSAGVVLYTMLCGYPPFYGNSDPEIFKKVLAGNFSFRGCEWKNVSNSAKDLIRNMLIVNTEMRYNSKQVLDHPWLCQSIPSPSLSLTYSQIDSYLTSSSLKKTVLLSIIVHSDDKSLSEAKEAFISLDQNYSGHLSKESIECYLTLNLPSQLETLKRFINSMDLNQNGLIEYSEFLSAIIDPSKILTKPRLLQTFHLFDRNKNGKISSDDLQKLLDKKSKKNLPLFKNMLLEINCKPSPGLTFEDFYEEITKNIQL
jgi:calcium-dependent protein kinase